MPILFAQLRHRLILEKDYEACVSEIAGAAFRRGGARHCSGTSGPSSSMLDYAVVERVLRDLYAAADGGERLMPKSHLTKPAKAVKKEKARPTG